jgi:hypothetical protein
MIFSRIVPSGGRGRLEKEQVQVFRKIGWVYLAMLIFVGVFVRFMGLSRLRQTDRANRTLIYANHYINSAYGCQVVKRVARW